MPRKFGPRRDERPVIPPEDDLPLFARNPDGVDSDEERRQQEYRARDARVAMRYRDFGNARADAPLGAYGDIARQAATLTYTPRRTQEVNPNDANVMKYLYRVRALPPNVAVLGREVNPNDADDMEYLYRDENERRVEERRVETRKRQRERDWCQRRRHVLHEREAMRAEEEEADVMEQLYNAARKDIILHEYALQGVHGHRTKSWTVPYFAFLDALNTRPFTPQDRNRLNDAIRQIPVYPQRMWPMDDLPALINNAVQGGPPVIDYDPVYPPSDEIGGSDVDEDNDATIVDQEEDDEKKKV